MRLLKSQVDQVDSPPSAGLTTNQCESRLIVVNSQIRDMRRKSRLVYWFTLLGLMNSPCRSGTVFFFFVSLFLRAAETRLFNPLEDFLDETRTE